MTVDPREGSYRWSSSGANIGTLTSGTTYQLWPQPTIKNYDYAVIKTLTIAGYAVVTGAGGGDVLVEVRWSGDENDSYRNITALQVGGALNSWLPFQSILTWGDGGMIIPGPRYVQVKVSKADTTVAGRVIASGYVVIRDEEDIPDIAPVTLAQRIKNPLNFGGVKI